MAKKKAIVFTADELSQAAIVTDQDVLLSLQVARQNLDNKFVNLPQATVKDASIAE